MMKLFKKPSINQMIEEIHETFYTEVDRLLADAKIAYSLDTDKQKIIDKSEKLKAIGFTNTKEVKEAEAEIERIDRLKKENKDKEDLVEAINYFSFKYPNYKFIVEESVKKICAKYGLIYGAIDRYIGDVPDKNLKHIEQFSINEKDEVYMVEETTWGIGVGRMPVKYKYFDKEGCDKYFNSDRFEQSHYYKHGDVITMCLPSMGGEIKRYKSILEIAAPLKDFNMEGREVKGHKILNIPDPVVLMPVLFKDKKHYLVVTAWGIEASDENVVNARHN